MQKGNNITQNKNLPSIKRDFEIDQANPQGIDDKYSLNSMTASDLSAPNMRESI